MNQLPIYYYFSNQKKVYNIENGSEYYNYAVLTRHFRENNKCYQLY